ncbi:MurNAc alpha-1-phosphate uridylyltransferase [Lutimaribacter pacificus]|uniref:MurNAc alpha-1-phosphate uridylyltransferase n=1 Tax=Lutimaribacter pacificus TaxID=391948 RepID=A0A1H0MA13_9RHOB|nr:nucleotidyltransferase family protein [Lutimaribacter pacificus]SDO77217.1 MurNAc alpha-1-phosphate uridylyltransferase [Lutimaribacter pacificus]SHK99866.1 MurNAc alpha-1-phosphate uridylyltransferase [Lutimaribacter pacificus]
MRNRPDAVMLFAAGFGTRMGALTRDRPKPLIEVAGQALLDHALALVADAGIKRAVANTHYMADKIAAHLAGRDVALSHETPDILETGGGLRHALPLLGQGPVFTMNTDAIWQGPNPLRLLAEAWDPARMDALLVTVPPENALGHGGAGDFLRDRNGRLSRGKGEVYSGVQIVKTDALADIAEPAFSLNLLWDRMLADDRLFGVSYPGRWCDVGRPEGIALAEAMIGGGDV